MLIGSGALSQKEANHDNKQTSGLMSLQYKNNKRSIHPGRIRRTVVGRATILLCAVILLYTIACSSASLSSRWLQHRLKRIAQAHLAIESTPIDASKASPLGENDSSHPPLLVVVTHEGQVWTIDSRDGSLLAGFSTGPPLLVVDDHFDEGDDAALESRQSNLAQSRIVPSMDGVLYWRQDNSKLMPIASIRELIDNPIQLCQAEGEENCDILTATSLGPSLFSLNAQGSLNWARSRSTGRTTRVKPVPMERTSSSGSAQDSGSESEGEEDDNEDDESTVNSSQSGKDSFLLQRQDYLVEQISTATGEQKFNITWASLESLDFGDEDRNVHYLSSDLPEVSELPSIIFGNQGKSLVAVVAEPPSFLWKKDFISVVTNVLGIEKGAWHPVHKVAETDGGRDPHVENRYSNGRGRILPELPSRSEPNPEEEAERWFWFWAGGAKGMGKKSKDLEQFRVHLQEDPNLVHVPRPSAFSMVRNSWYLNHLWASPRATGEQRFQGYLSDHSHKEEGSMLSGLASHPQPPKDLYDTSNMRKVLFLPSPEPPMSDIVGGLFLPWPIVMAIITLLVGAVGAAYILYGHKKRKWMATNTENVASASSDRGVPGVTSESVSLSMEQGQGKDASAGDQEISLSRSRERSQSHSEAIKTHNSTRSDERHNAPSNGRAPSQVLYRSTSAPIMSTDHALSVSGLLSGSLASSSHHHRQQIPPEESASVPPREERPAEKVEKHPLMKHQSAPVATTNQMQGGVGMIDGIPLIRYSRYQSEFRELEPLGRGGFGSVFRVANVLDGREYAVKKVSIRSSDWDSPGTESFSQELHRVLREVKFLALLDHPSIVRYYTAWLEMEEKGEDSPEVDENLNSKTLSRKYSSELLTSMDPNGRTSRSMQGSKAASTTRSRATLSHLKGRNTNPLGWNNGLNNFEDSSASEFFPRHSMPLLPPTDEDCGFIFEERSNEDEEEESSYIGNGHYSRGASVESSVGSKSEFSHSLSSSWDASYSANFRTKNSAVETNKTIDEKREAERKSNKSSKHTLYIQMQLCSSKTLADFLADKEARQGASAGAAYGKAGSIDIPRALRLFHQIVQAVHHVHQQNLIHRDLKPSNCFIDDTGTVKVGDFGLSRESSDGNDESSTASLILDGPDDGGGDNTVGVGTRSYASPEQMNGSDYDSKTDIYSLGIMLFELLYPMYTGMERHICLQKLRADTEFPDEWHSTVSLPFPTLDGLLRSMLSHNPKHRPTADEIARHIRGLLEEHSVSLNIGVHDGDIDKITFIRVEANPAPDILKVLIELLHDAASPKKVDIIQYGMRSSTKSSGVPGKKGEERAILEFALAANSIDARDLPSWGSKLASKLQQSDQVLVARHVWHQKAQTF